MLLLYKVLNVKADGEMSSLSWMNDKNKSIQTVTLSSREDMEKCLMLPLFIFPVLLLLSLVQIIPLIRLSVG